MQQRRPVVHIAGLDVSLGGKLILKGVNLSVYEGELLALLGPNGAGKSTLTQSIIGQINPGKGQVRIAGRNPCRSKLARQAVGLVPQHIALYEKLTPLENLAMARALGRASDLTLQQALEKVELYGFEDVPTRNLSAGQQRRLALARLLVTDAELWILDEPFTSLDVDGIELIEQLLDQHTSAGGMLAVTSHHAVNLKNNRAHRINLSA